jgi:hypothetical protein
VVCPPPPLRAGKYSARQILDLESVSTSITLVNALSTTPGCMAAFATHSPCTTMMNTDAGHSVVEVKADPLGDVALDSQGRVYWLKGSGGGVQRTTFDESLVPTAALPAAGRSEAILPWYYDRPLVASRSGRYLYATFSWDTGYVIEVVNTTAPDTGVPSTTYPGVGVKTVYANSDENKLGVTHLLPGAGDSLLIVTRTDLTLHAYNPVNGTLRLLATDVRLACTTVGASDDAGVASLAGGTGLMALYEGKSTGQGFPAGSPPRFVPDVPGTVIVAQGVSERAAEKARRAL